MITIEEAIEIFHYDLPEEIQLTCETDMVLKPLVELEERYKVILSPLVIFMVIGEVTSDDLLDYIENEFKFDEAKAKQLAVEFTDKVFKPLVDRINFINDSPDKNMTLEQEKIYLENIFKKGVLDELSYDAIIKEAVNRRVFFILARDFDFKKKLEQALYDNEEILTSQPILLNDQEVKPTISNWLKDFIGRYGSQAYDSVSASTFLVNSDNGKNLIVSDREKLSELLKLYVNIKFFPDSMPSDEGEDWQIIPYEEIKESDDNKTEEIDNKKEPKDKTVKTQSGLTEKTIKLNEDKVSTPPIVINDNNVLSTETDELLELKNMLLQYPEGSLERAAIEEEIKKLQT